MAKVEHRRFNKAQRQALREEFLSILHALKAGNDVLAFLGDFFTESEFIMFARRVSVAQRLLAGHSYHHIKQDLHVGLDTVQVVHEWLDGKFEDYRSVLPTLKNKGPRRVHKHRVPIEPYSFRGLRRRYPMHFLLFNVLLGDPRFVWVEED